ncbi:hypothetical protein GTP46_13395 [Duganella sp. FT135W]|uniref:Uncharacterized protein n=2 Tax=Duganella flavida TaxID=2692175 RepID=A0A6L8KD07_9BURK|nr:hypothetical protein [Duganella flavida]
MGYGVRAVVVVAVLALACSWGVAQIGPRYVIELRSQGGSTEGMARGRVQLAGRGMALVRFQGLSVLTVDADTQSYSDEEARNWPEADLVLVTPPTAGHFFGLGPLMKPPGRPAIVPLAPGETISSKGMQLYPMAAWETLDLRKANTKLRVTAMAGAQGTRGVAGFMLELGNSRSSYRVYVSCAEDEAAALAQRLPGADLALVPARGAPRLLALNRGAPLKDVPAVLTAAGYAFTADKR